MRRIERLIKRWPMLVIRAGLVMFCLACLYSERLPTEALLVGPAVMVAGGLMAEYNKRQR